MPTIERPLNDRSCGANQRPQLSRNPKLPICPVVADSDFQRSSAYPHQVASWPLYGAKRTSGIACRRRFKEGPVACAGHRCWASCAWRPLSGWFSCRPVISSRTWVCQKRHRTSSITGASMQPPTLCRRSAVIGAASLQSQSSFSLGRPEANSDSLRDGPVARVRARRAPIYRGLAHPLRKRRRSPACNRPALRVLPLCFRRRKRVGFSTPPRPAMDRGATASRETRCGAESPL